MIHKCKRCGYETTARQSLRTHLMKKKTCEPIMSNTEVIVLLQEINTKQETIYNEITYNCTFCQKRFNSTGNKSRHQKVCTQAKIQITNQDLLNLESKILDKLLKSNMNDKKEQITTDSINESELGYLYIIQLREFVKNNEHVYKIGKTKDLFKRFSAYPKQSILMYSVRTDNISDKETLLKNNLKQKLLHRTDLGYEYFEGDINIIKAEIDVLT